MTALGDGSGSLLEMLEQAKALFRQERFDLAFEHFQRIGSAASFVAPDVWIEATWGVAECRRLAHEFGRSAAAYRAVVARASAARIPAGRLGQSNRFAVVYSFVGLLEIGRLCLRVTAPVLDDLASEGRAFAAREIGGRAAWSIFRLAALMQERNRIHPAVAAQGFEELHRQVAAADPQDHGADPIVVEMRLSETRLDARILLPPPLPSPREHWAHRWTAVMHRLLAARRLSLLGRSAAAARELAAVEHAADDLARYPELRPTHAWLQARDARGALRDEAWSHFGRIVHEGIERARGRAANLSTPLWHLLQMVLEQIAGEEPSTWWRRPRAALPDTLRRDVATLHEQLRDQPELRGVLASRGVAPEELETAVRWCAACDGSPSWRRDGRPILEGLQRTVRP